MSKALRSPYSGPTIYTVLLNLLVCLLLVCQRKIQMANTTRTSKLLPADLNLKHSTQRNVTTKPFIIPFQYSWHVQDLIFITVQLPVSRPICTWGLYVQKGTFQS